MIGRRAFHSALCRSDSGTWNAVLGTTDAVVDAGVGVQYRYTVLTRRIASIVKRIDLSLASRNAPIVSSFLSLSLSLSPLFLFSQPNCPLPLPLPPEYCYNSVHTPVRPWDNDKSRVFSVLQIQEGNEDHNMIERNPFNGPKASNFHEATSLHELARSLRRCRHVTPSSTTTSRRQHHDLKLQRSSTILDLQQVSGSAGKLASCLS